MTDVQTLYPYATGPLLEQPNTYFYTAYQGRTFIDAWKNCRGDVRLLSIEPSRPSENIDTPQTDNNIRTQVLLLNMINCEQNDHRYWLQKLVKKFEVSKRLYKAYEISPPHRVMIGADYHNLDLYLLFAELLIEENGKQARLQLLNTLLKVMDTLVAYSAQMTKIQRGNLNWLIEQEQIIFSKIQQVVIS